MEQTTILKINGLTKKFDSRTAVDHISLEIREGEIFGLLGPNGAGKSTTLNMVCSLLKPTSGSIEVFGMDAAKHMKQIKRRIGYIPQDLAIHGNLKAWENVEHVADVVDVPQQIGYAFFQRFQVFLGQLLLFLCESEILLGSLALRIRLVEVVKRLAGLYRQIRVRLFKL